MSFTCKDLKGDVFNIENIDKNCLLFLDSDDMKKIERLNKLENILKD